MSYESLKSAAREAAKSKDQVREAVRLGFEMKRELEAKRKRKAMFIDVPSDVMELAKKQCDLCGITPASDMRIQAEHVAAFAIMEERRRCAQVAEDWKGHPADFHFAGKQIAKSIRAALASAEAGG